MNSKILGSIKYVLRSAGTLGMGPVFHSSAKVVEIISKKLACLFGKGNTNSVFSVVTGLRRGFTKGIAEVFGFEGLGQGGRLIKGGGDGKNLLPTQLNEAVDQGGGHQEKLVEHTQQEGNDSTTTLSYIEKSYIQEKLAENPPVSLRTLFKKN